MTYNTLNRKADRQVSAIYSGESTSLNNRQFLPGAGRLFFMSEITNQCNNSTYHYHKREQIRICNHRHHPPSQARSRCNRSSASKVSVLYCQSACLGVGSTRAAFIYTMMNTCGSIHISNKTMIIIARIIYLIVRIAFSYICCLFICCLLMWNLYYIKKADSPVHCYTEVISFTSGFDKIKGEPHSLYLIF